MHDVRRIVHKATDAGLVPLVTPLAPLSFRKHHVYFLGRMTVVRISRLRSQKTHAYPNIAAYLKPLRSGDCRIGVVVQELLSVGLSAGSDLPVQLWFDCRECAGQGADRAWLAAHILQRHLKMPAHWQSR